MEEFFKDYWPIISAVSAFLGAGISWFVAQMLTVRKIESGERSELMDRIHKYSERQDDRMRERDDQIEKLTKALIEARFKLAEYAKSNILPIEVVRAVIDSDIGLSWATERVGPKKWRMIRVSPGYARLYLGGTSRIYDGKYDHEIWGESLGEIFTVENEQVYSEQTGMLVRSRVKSQQTGAEGFFIGRKFSVRLDTGEDIVFGSGDHMSEADARLLFGNAVDNFGTPVGTVKSAKNKSTKKKK